MNNAIVDRFLKSGLSVREFADKADLKYSTAHDIVKGKANIEKIGAGAFVRISHVLGTTADDLLNECMGVSSLGKVQVSEDEHELLTLYRSMSEDEKSLILDTARRFAAFSGEGGSGSRRAAEKSSMTVA